MSALPDMHMHISDLLFLSMDWHCRVPETLQLRETLIDSFLDKDLVLQGMKRAHHISPVDVPNFLPLEHPSSQMLRPEESSLVHTLQ